MPRGPQIDLSPLEERLREVQGTRGLTDKEMGATFGLTEEGWRAVRLRKRRMGMAVMYWAPKKFREVQPDWLSFFFGSGHDGLAS